MARGRRAAPPAPPGAATIPPARVVLVQAASCLVQLRGRFLVASELQGLRANQLAATGHAGRNGRGVPCGSTEMLNFRADRRGSSPARVSPEPAPCADRQIWNSRPERETRQEGATAMQNGAALRPSGL